MKERLSLNGEKCPSCGKGMLHAILRAEDFDVDLGNEKIKVHVEKVPVETCDTCQEVLSGAGAARIRDEALRQAAGLLLPSEMKSIRENIGWSQQYLANVSGFRMEQISLWERGRTLQSRGEDNFMRALRDCPPLREYLEGLLSLKNGKHEAGILSKAV